MSDIISDTRAIAERIKPWEPPDGRKSYTSTEIPDWEYLRVHTLRLCTVAEELRKKVMDGAAKVHELQGILSVFPTSYKRDPESDCEDFERGPQDNQSTCETDGHFLCGYCKHRTLGDLDKTD